MVTLVFIVIKYIYDEIIINLETNKFIDYAYKRFGYYI
jgi:hypothetical protein